MRNKKLWIFLKQLSNKEQSSSFASTFLECFQRLLFNIAQPITFTQIQMDKNVPP